MKVLTTIINVAIGYFSMFQDGIFAHQKEILCLIS